MPWGGLLLGLPLTGRLDNERTYVTEWALEDLALFVKRLRPADEVAVEITGNRG
jgi:hypothetical protein